tara:strand:+ start:17493 stop:18185 length:693 start_codon:yes stop_codon:yes gene_type:complete
MNIQSKDIKKNIEVSKKPFNKNQIEYFSERLSNIINSKERELKLKYNEEIEKLSKKNKQTFVKSLNLDNLTKQLKQVENKITKSLDNKNKLVHKLNEEISKLDKLIQTTEKKYEAQREKLDIQNNQLVGKIRSALDRMNDLREWGQRFEIEQIRDIVDLQRFIDKACYAETTEAFYKSVGAEELQKVSNTQTAIMDAIYSNNLDRNILEFMSTKLEGIGIKNQYLITNNY